MLQRNPIYISKIPQDTFWVKFPAQFLIPLMRQPLKTAFLLAILEQIKTVAAVFKIWSIFSFKSQSHGTSLTNPGYLKIHCYYKSKTYGRYAIILKAIYLWSDLQGCHQNVRFHELRANKLKEILITFFLNEYN